MEGVPALVPHVKSGALKAIAVTGDRRLAALPNTPSFAELGYPAIGLTWVAVVAPAGTPQAAITRLNEEFVRAMTLPDVKAAQESAGRVVVASSAEHLAQVIRTELPEWASVVRSAGLKPE
jgi:tripartite-type tricarboxylate transporter receptor subunit TctC